MAKVSARRKRKPEAPRKPAARPKRKREARVEHGPANRADKLDQALEMTFPASDPIAVGKPTSTEVTSGRAAGRAAPRHPATTSAQNWVEICTRPWAIWTAWALILSPWHRVSERRISNDNDHHLNS